MTARRRKGSRPGGCDAFPSSSVLLLLHRTSHVPSVRSIFRSGVSSSDSCCCCPSVRPSAMWLSGRCRHHSTGETEETATSRRDSESLQAHSPGPPEQARFPRFPSSNTPVASRTGSGPLFGLPAKMSSDRRLFVANGLCR